MGDSRLNKFETEVELLGRIPDIVINDNSYPFRPKSLMLQWHLTNQCNLRCQHCYQNEYNDKTDLSLEKLHKILNQYLQLLQKWNIKGHINFTGGEPLLNDHWQSLAETLYSFKSICSFAMLSNGSKLNGPIAKKLKDLDCKFFQISIEGSKNTHDNIRGAGNFDLCSNSLDLLRKTKIQTMVSFTSSKLNSDEFESVVKFCKKKHVDVLWTDRFLPMGNGKETIKELMEPEEVEKFFGKLYRWHNKLHRSWFSHLEIRNHRALNFLISHKHGCDCYAPYSCKAGLSLLTVLPNGDLLPCRRMPIIVGNVLHTPIEVLYENSQLFKRLRNTSNNYPGCENCKHWKLCKGGLRCLSYAYHGTPFKADPQCFITHKRLSTK